MSCFRVVDIVFQGLQVVEEISNMVTLGYTTPLSDDIAYRQCIQSSTETHNQTAISVELALIVEQVIHVTELVTRLKGKVL